MALRGSLNLEHSHRASGGQELKDEHLQSLLKLLFDQYEELLLE